MRRWCLVLVIVIGGGVGCSGSDGEPLDDLGLLCDESSGVVTKYLTDFAACASPALRNPLYSREYQANNCRGTYGPLLDAQVAVIDRDAIARCRTALKTSCSPEHYKDWEQATLVCDHVIDGTRSAGGACSIDDECQGPAYCAISAGSCGTCAVQQTDGSACRTDQECESGVCAPGGACLARASRSVNESCVDDAQCGTGLGCRSGVCTRFGEGLDKPCRDDVDCGAYEGTCAHGTCIALAEAGQDCSPAVNPVSVARCKWFEGMGCLDGTCKKMPRVELGAACGYDLALCAGELACISGKCSTVVPEGGACTYDECGPYAVCLDGACSFTAFRNVCTAAVGP